MHCSSSTAGTSVRLTRSWAGCPDRIVVSGLPPDGEVFLLTSPFIDRYPVQDTHEPRLKVKDENVGWKHTCSGCSHAGFERIGSRTGYNPVQDIYILQRSSSCDKRFRYSEFMRGPHNVNLPFGGFTASCINRGTLQQNTSAGILRCTFFAFFIITTYARFGRLFR